MKPLTTKIPNKPKGRKQLKLLAASLLGLTILCSVGGNGSPAQAKDSSSSLDADSDTSGDSQQEIRDHDDFFDNKSARTLFLAAKQDMKRHNYLRAIKKLEEAVKLDPDDMDVRCLYAESMQEKLSHQVDKDPDLFNKCVQTWLKVMRNEVGEEKGLTYKGIGIDNGMFGDEERSQRAKLELKTLTGYIPKPWETNDHYLKRVLKNYSASVTAVVKIPQAGDKQEESTKPEGGVKQQDAGPK